MKKYFNYTLILVALSLIVLSGCSLPGLGDGNAKDDVKITTTETSETKIIGHMEKLLIEHETDGKINRLPNKKDDISEKKSGKRPRENRIPKANIETQAANHCPPHP